MTLALNTLTEAKALARRLRPDVSSHAAALERVAQMAGARDWNTLRQQLTDGPPRSWTPGGRVRGRYLSQPFQATVKTVEQVAQDRIRLTLHLDQPVDVVRFDSFSNLRQRITGTVGLQGFSPDHTSDGEPVLVLTL